MNTLVIRTGLAIIAMGVSLSSFADNPCMPIATACMQQGYYKGGHSTGKGLVEDCVKPIVTKSKTLPNTTFTDDVLTKCAATIATKMQGDTATPQ